MKCFLAKHCINYKVQIWFFLTSIFFSQLKINVVGDKITDSG